MKKNLKKMQPGGAKVSRNLGLGTLIGGTIAGIANEFKKNRTENLKRKYNAAAIEASSSGVGKGKAMADKEKYARKLATRGYDINALPEEKNGGPKMMHGGQLRRQASVNGLRTSRKHK